MIPSKINNVAGLKDGEESSLEPLREFAMYNLTHKAMPVVYNILLDMSEKILGLEGAIKELSEDAKEEPAPKPRQTRAKPKAAETE